MARMRGNTSNPLTKKILTALRQTPVGEDPCTKLVGVKVKTIYTTCYELAASKQNDFSDEERETFRAHARKIAELHPEVLPTRRERKEKEKLTLGDDERQVIIETIGADLDDAKDLLSKGGEGLSLIEFFAERAIQLAACLKDGEIGSEDWKQVRLSVLQRSNRDRALAVEAAQ